MAKKTGKRNQHVAAFISKLLLGAAAVSFAPKLTLAEEIQKDSLDWNAAYYNNSYEKFVTESELGYYIAVNNYLYFVEKESLTPILLCNKPNCMHKDNSCQAIFQQGQAQIVYYDGMIYGIDDTGIFSKGNRTYNLMEITADGENRDKKAVIETDGNNFLIHRNQIFTTYIDEDDHGVITAFDLETGKQESIYRSEWNMSQIMDLYAYEDRLYFSETGVDDNETYIAALDCTDLSTGETVENLLQNSPEIEDSEAYVVGISDEKLYIRLSSMDTMKSDIYVCDLDGTDAKYITQMSLGQTVMDDENIYLASFEDNQIYVYTKEGEQVSVITIEEKSQDERHLLDVNPVAGSGQYGFISCFFFFLDGQVYRSILAFDKEKLEMGNAALQTIVEGSLYDMH